MIWMNKSLCALVKKTEIKPRFLSDHSPIVVSIFGMRPKVFNRRLKEELLMKTENIEYIHKEIKAFFKDNWTGGNRKYNLGCLYERAVNCLRLKGGKMKEKNMRDLQDKINEKEKNLKGKKDQIK